ncbi:alpha/beta hydrolase [Lactococcus fujiensis]|uniref:Lipase/esterase n=1 Tax=Lactococcus fujiensis JCM 16395 TaxID=1291764 RepID=A0A2A5RM42_9LACT|nr:alpha/beta hydrolase [Lactococcus fujiensis]PCS00391.1 lipase/esterase [Lactococcus fujiensis JCM 16395]
MQIENITINSTAELTFYNRKNPRLDHRSQPAVIICPGGGYKVIAEREAEPLALAFSSQGFQVFILNYTVMSKGTTENFLNQDIEELHEGLELIRENKTKWEIDEDNIFLLGCSAGGHVVSRYCNFNLAKKPKGVLLCYPVTSLSFGWPKDFHHFNFEIEDLESYNACEMVNPDTPPTFIWHTINDKTVPVYNTLKYCERLSKYNVSVEAHIFDDGPHGLSLATRASSPNDSLLNDDVSRWFNFALQWINRKLD